MSDKATNSSLEKLEAARDQLRDGIKTTREIVRKTQILIELTGCEGVAANDNKLDLSD